MYVHYEGEKQIDIDKSKAYSNVYIIPRPLPRCFVDSTSKKGREWGGRVVRGWDGPGGGMGVEGELSPASVGSQAGSDNRKRVLSAQRL
jgi:hypothetical protein